MIAYDYIFLFDSLKCFSVLLHAQFGLISLFGRWCVLAAVLFVYGSILHANHSGSWVNLCQVCLRVQLLNRSETN